MPSETKCCECIEVISKFSQYKMLIRIYSVLRHEASSEMSSKEFRFSLEDCDSI